MLACINARSGKPDATRTRIEQSRGRGNLLPDAEACAECALSIVAVPWHLREPPPANVALFGNRAISRGMIGGCGIIIIDR